MSYQISTVDDKPDGCPMRIMQFIPDDHRRAKVLALAARRHLPAHTDGALVCFDVPGDQDPELVNRVLKAVGQPIPAPRR